MGADRHNRTKLYKAARSEDCRTLEQLLRRGENADYAREDRWPLTGTRRHQGWTALMVAAANGRFRAVHMLLDGSRGWKAADPNVVDAKGRTALHAAVCSDKYDTGIVLELLRAGADLDNQDRAGNTVFHTLTKPRYQKRVGRIFNDLLPHKPLLNLRNCRGETPLTMAAKRGAVTFVRAIVTCPCPMVDLDARDDDGNTALHLVSRVRGTDEVVSLLVLGGADLEAQNYWGMTPLAQAMVRYNMFYDRPYVSALLTHLARPMVEGTDYGWGLFEMDETMKTRYKTALHAQQFGSSSVPGTARQSANLDSDDSSDDEDAVGFLTIGDAGLAPG
ncbi:hypothetical protein J8273_1579 [Carpediemonas membranifera]|uniref:Ankyrin repeat protein n=1 Tax=Carpediemonas membranifera TaxID=201153 RepID=A0A8J6AWG0_9EUKA|nr:hypothetical protein J8273_1579 [Carpediemonas membranifera]|eukprot:KAG9396571.1 hypothetical protein J8273_1579 [Carpediemonas membranifera]